MKIHVEIDLSPQEARTFFGLPDVEPLNEALIEEIKRRMEAGAEGYDPMSLMRPYFAQNVQAMETMQKALWGAFGKKGSPPGD